MRLTIAYSKINKRNLVLINNDTYQREFNLIRATHSTTLKLYRINKLLKRLLHYYATYLKT